MKSINSKKKIAALILLAVFGNASAFAAPKVLYKDMNAKQHVLAINTMPQAISGVVKDIQVKQPDLYQIVVYQHSDHYLLYLLSGKSWSMTKIRVDLDNSGKIKRLIDSYQENEKELQTSTEAEPVCPDNSVQFLAISAYPGVAAVDKSIAIVSEAAKKKFKTVTISSETADGKTYKNWLSCPNLKGIYSIGHGAPEGIMVGNGDMISSDFFTSEKFINKYKKTTVIINACQVFNYPFGTELMFGSAEQASAFAHNPGPSAYQYMGGHTNLVFFYSELSSACFIAKAIDGARMDYNTLKKCVGNQDIHYQSFGLSQPGKYFQ